MTADRCRDGNQPSAIRAVDLAILRGIDFLPLLIEPETLAESRARWLDGVTHTTNWAEIQWAASRFDVGTSIGACPACSIHREIRGPAETKEESASASGSRGRYALGCGGLYGTASVLDGSPGFQVDSGQHGGAGGGFFGMASHFDGHSKMSTYGIDQ